METLKILKLKLQNQLQQQEYKGFAWKLTNLKVVNL